ncbi:MAG: DUF429 domain-containing protein [Candidatus Saccharicenans sp.]|nr:DUF429 domain-containing protein [Candidatus Saccharicenans sp.]
MTSAYCIAGIDLAGSPRRATGFCLLRSGVITTSVLFSDLEILEAVKSARPEIVAIDAPLSLPPGRRRIEDRTGSHFRSCDLALRQKGIRFFPITLGPMRLLTTRGRHLARLMRKAGCRVIEVYPGGAQDVWGLPRARQDRKALARGLKKLATEKFGLISGKETKPWREMTADELDAVTAALVGLLYIQGRAELYGKGKKIIVMPPPLKS